VDKINLMHGATRYMINERLLPSEIKFHVHVFVYFCGIIYYLILLSYD